MVNKYRQNLMDEEKPKGTKKSLSEYTKTDEVVKVIEVKKTKMVNEVNTLNASFTNRLVQKIRKITIKKW